MSDLRTDPRPAVDAPRSAAVTRSGITAVMLWWRGLLRRRWGRLTATALGVATAVALLASLGQFLAGAQDSMTRRAIESVAVDWQVEVQPGTDVASALDTIRATPGIQAVAQVEFAETTGLSASTLDAAGGQTLQTTGAGQVLGLPADYTQRFPGAIRTLAGDTQGVILAQQTASNLRVRVGDPISIARPGQPPAEVRVGGVVELVQADSLFQKVGAPAGAQPSAPPDNVVLMPLAQWQSLFPQPARTQFHVQLAHNLAHDPATAFTAVTASAHNLEARSTGGVLVGDNLAAALDAARSDAAYARILFLFLGLPGAVLAAMLTSAVAASGAQRRRTEQALLRSRGASARQVLGLASVEAFTVGVPGSLLGVAVAVLVGRFALGTTGFGLSTPDSALWAGGAALVGLLIAASVVIIPAYLDWKHASVMASRAAAPRHDRPLWMRFGLDILALAVAALVFWASSSNNYQLVLAPEGVPSVSVSYWAFAAPALLWLGGALVVWRLIDLLLRRGKRAISWAVRVVTGSLSDVVVGSMSRRRRLITRSIVLLTLAIAFAGSTAVFNSTYRAQAEVDAKLTNGADVTVTNAPNATAADLGSVPGVQSVEPLQHRFAYVGADLQDLYGVRPDTISAVTALQDSYFQGGTAQELMGRLASSPDGILVSAETASDFQLKPGDLVMLRLPNASTGQTVSVPFHYAGVVSEFPTAPKDSFLVANGSYIASKTGTQTAETFLVDTGGQDTTAVAARIRERLGPSATVNDIATARAKVGSSLTAVDLSGLTTVELAFALLIAAASGGLVLALGLNERRRQFAIVKALGGTRRHVRSMIAGETVSIVVGGVVAGVALGWLLAEVLVAVLSGVFDPPPSALTVPWGYLAGLGGLALAAVFLASGLVARTIDRDVVSSYRDT
jgi:putative ABC transport system permease protein